MKTTSLCAILLLVLSSSINAQEFFVRGSVTEKNSSAPLAYTNIRVAGTTSGTSANRNGSYELKLKKGNYVLIASYIGYVSDTIRIDLNHNMNDVNFELEETNVDLEEIIVLPGVNPAIEIIRKAIERKRERKNKLRSYEFEAYTKGLIKTEDDINARGNTVNVSVGGDSAELKISGIIENQSKAYFKAPNQYKEIITARKQSANLPASINVLTGGRVIQNFYEDDLNFLGRNLPGPLADNALDYYYYYIEEMTALDTTPVYNISITPDNTSDPGFEGNIFITKNTFDLLKVDLRLNRAANTGGIFDTVNVFQQLASYEENIYMPVDYRLLVNVNLLGLARIGFELNTIMYDYKINPEIEDDFFNMAIVQVLPEADKKDSTFWVNTLTIPNTTDEQAAYKQIDSVQSIPYSVWDNFSFLSDRINWTETFYTSAPISMYHFNRVEGHALDFSLGMNDAFEQRLDSRLSLSHGFADKRMKEDFNISYLAGDYRTTRFNLNAYNRVNVLFGSSDNYNEITGTILALVSKYEFRDYFYSNGFDAEVAAEVFPVLQLNAGFINRTDKNAFVNTDYSFFNKEKKFKDNPLIDEVKVNAVKAGFRLDFRNYVEDGLFRRRFSAGRSFIVFDGDVTYSNTDLFKSKTNFTKYELRTFGEINSFRSARLYFNVFMQSNDGRLPFQMLYALPGNIDWLTQNNSFRTLEFNEIVGENVVTVYLEHQWRDELFRLLSIPVIKDLELQLNTFLNIAYSDLDGNTSVPGFSMEEFKNPFYEAGFGLGHVLLPMQLEFAWKLNHRGRNNFRFGFNMILL